jgi:uncharacterized protein (TIGR04255 family)
MGRAYRNPPILEALSEVFYRGSEWDGTVPGRFYEKVRDRFPRRKQRGEIEVEVQVAGGMPSTRTTPKEPRSQFEQEDGARIVQVGRDLVVLNQLRPYPHFAEWKPLAVEAATVYRQLANPTGVERIGMRYLNRIEIPETSFPMERYFTLHVHIPESLGSTHGSFVLRIELEPLHRHHHLLVTFASAPSETGASSSFMLDLYDRVTPSEPEAFERLGEYLDEGHENIERTFESIITDETRKLFGEAET